MIMKIKLTKTTNQPSRYISEKSNPTCMYYVVFIVQIRKIIAAVGPLIGQIKLLLDFIFQKTATGLILEK